MFSTVNQTIYHTIPSIYHTCNNNFTFENITIKKLRYSLGVFPKFNGTYLYYIIYVYYIS